MPTGARLREAQGEALPMPLPAPVTMRLAFSRSTPVPLAHGFEQAESVRFIHRRNRPFRSGES